MKFYFLQLSALFISSISFSCPDIAGKWKCYENSLDYQYQENFLVTKTEGFYSYSQILTDEAGEQPTFEKVTDTIEEDGTSYENDFVGICSRIP